MTRKIYENHLSNEQAILILILTNNKLPWNRKSSAMIYQLIPKIIIFRCIIITTSSNHWRSSEMATTPIMIFLLIGNLLLWWLMSRWLWWAHQALTCVTALLFCIRSIPPDSRSLFQMDYISSQDSYFSSKCLVINGWENVWVNMLCCESLLIHSGIHNVKLCFCKFEKLEELGR